MERIIIPKLNISDLGEAKMGWYMDELQVDWDKEKRYPCFQSPCCNKRSSLKLHSIKPDGEINNSILCLCGQFHVFGILENWPSEYQKREGELTIEHA